MKETIKTLLQNVPHKAGIYLMKDKDGVIIYVGKAKNLQKRVSSYFVKAKHATKVQRMVEQVESFEYLEVKNELEALVLETNYIKEHRPKYNILMRDDKNHLYIKVTTNEPYPRVYTTRKIVKDGATYFGPKTSAGDVKKTLKLLRKLFPYRTCTLGIEDNEQGGVTITNKTISYPCIYYHIKRCMGPCIKSCNPEYAQMTADILSFLKGDYGQVVDNLQTQMIEHAEKRQFEKAAHIRDIVKSLRHMTDKQAITQADPSSNQDVVGYALKFGKCYIAVLQVREGKLVRHEYFTYSLPLSEEEDAKKLPEGIMFQFVRDYMERFTEYPKELLLPKSKDTLHISEWLKEEYPKAPKVLTPERGKKKELLVLANTNALAHATQEQSTWYTKQARTKGALQSLAKALGLSIPPERIECYDISHLSGTQTVGSMVVFGGGKPAKSEYRRFKIKTLPDGTIDDFRSLQEVLSRRLKYIKELEDKEDSLHKVPDLIIIDGGKGQLSHVMEIAESMDVELPIVSLAKREEEIYLPGESRPLMLPRESEELYLVQNIRDEAHRFAISYNRNLRAKTMTTSILDKISGIGPKKKKQLMKHFGNTKAIEAASLEEVAAVVGEKAALSVKEVL